ncbi:MAG: DUF1731 domain-containing protein [Flavobacteriia bacterium]|nr:DUF1731 domain-containing protein [Flavobacteriia bacterium]
MKTWIIAGGTGFIGESLAQHLVHLGFRVIVLSRDHRINSNGVEFFQYDYSSPNSIVPLIEGADVLVNLCGKSVDTRYTKANKKELYDSRLKTTSVLGDACRLATLPPGQVLQMSTATIYRDSISKTWDEQGEFGSGFSVDLAKKWEATARTYFPSNTSLAILRTSIVLGSKGAYPHYKWIARAGFRGFGGRDLRFSWIHINDFCRACVFLAGKNAGGVYNLASSPVTIREFLEEIAHVSGGLNIAKMPEWMVKFGAVMLRTESELLLKSRNVVGKRLIDEGFDFKWPNIYDAIHQLERHSEATPTMNEAWN